MKLTKKELTTVARPQDKVFGAMKDIKFDDKGLVPLIVQDAASGTVLSLFYANQEALEMTKKTGFVWRYSRTYSELMQKGASSGNVQKVVSMAKDCEGKSLLARVIPKGPGCHTGKFSCFDAAVPAQDVPVRKTREKEVDG
jgi:phosphoribosyl-AMP cyclohydrolase / phosphoribosyl-ATP pyrophosphohydrolase